MKMKWEKARKRKWEREVNVKNQIKGYRDMKHGKEGERAEEKPEGERRVKMKEGKEEEEKKEIKCMEMENEKNR